MKDHSNERSGHFYIDRIFLRVFQESLIESIELTT
jgi:hypothetical protein